MSDPIETTVEVMGAPAAIESIERAQIDMQIATAKRYPRTISQVKAQMLSFATLDEETAAACFYSVPRGGKNIQGPSVRLAEIAVSSYGNLRAGSRIIQTVTTGDAPHVTVQAFAHDLEKNIAVTIEKRRRITAKKDRNGGRRPVDEDDINLASNAGSAIAFRDAVFKVIPMALIKPVFEQAKRVAIGDAKTLADRRAKCVDAFAKMGVAKERVLAKLEKRSVEDIGLEDIETLLGLHNAIKDGAMAIEEAFAEEPKKEQPTFERKAKEESKTEPTGTLYERLLFLCKNCQISEAEILTILQRKGLTAAEELMAVADAALIDVEKNWDAFVAQVKIDRKGAK